MCEGGETLAEASDTLELKSGCCNPPPAGAGNKL